MKLNKKQIQKFTDTFGIKAKSIIMIDKGNVITIVINGARVFDVKKELVKEFF